MKQKLAYIMMLGFVMGSAFAADNSIYIDQSGDNTSVTVTQDGAGNVVRGIQGVGSDNTTPAKIYGNSNTVTIDQVGSGNTLNFGVTTTVVNGYTGNQFNYSITGNNSTAIINSNSNGQGTSGSNIIDITQTGNSSYANINVLGSKNSVTATTTGGSGNSVTSAINGDSNTQSIMFSGGGGNTANVTQGTTGATNSNGTVSITGVGASNSVTVSQTGGVAGVTNGDSATVSLNGSSNTVGITQQGTAGNSVVNVQSVGSSNTFSINTNAH